MKKSIYDVIDGTETDAELEALAEVILADDSEADKIYYSEEFQKLFTDVSSNMPNQQKSKNAEENIKRAENIINEVKKLWKGQWLPELHDKMMDGMF